MKHSQEMNLYENRKSERLYTQLLQSKERFTMKRFRCEVVVILVLAGGCITTPPSEDLRQSIDPGIVSNLFDTPWDDATLFCEGLVSSEKAVDLLLNATVYHIDLHILDGCLLLEGHQEVRYVNQESEPLNEIYFRLFPNITGGKTMVSAIKVDNQEIEPFYECERSALRILLPVALQPGEQVIIEMDFTVEVAQEMGGNYGLFGYFDGVLVLDGFYPVIPVYDDEEWNVEVPPSHGDLTYFDASFYLVRVKAPAALKVVASGIEIGRTHEGGNQVLAFAAGPARDFYIAASETYVAVSKTVGETTVNSYASAELEEGMVLALEVAVNAVKQFSQRFGVYPYTEFDIVSTPMLARGMEYPGIVAISAKLYDPDAFISGLPSQVMMESVVAHETAHQWFYNVVGNDQVDEPWLDEAMAQYLTGLYYLDVHGESSAQEYCSSWDQLWGNIDYTEIPIGLPSEAYTDEEYTPIIYGRGPLFLKALAEAMGQEVFDQFLQDYYQSHKWEEGTGEAFKQLAEYRCQCDLTALFEEWIYQ